LRGGVASAWGLVDNFTEDLRFNPAKHSRGEAALAQFKIDTGTNSIVPLTARTFGELGFKERGNLQEWIVKEPSCLGASVKSSW
jgi:hypothetical protein